jgi:TRAP-type C4-dicarboxylate transport system permease small subunit
VRAIEQTLERTLRIVDRIIRFIVVAALLLITAVLFFNSIGRSVLNISFVGGPALGRLLVIWLTFLGAYLTVRSGTHITVDLVKRLFPQRALRHLAILVGLSSALTCAYIAWLGALFTRTRFVAGQIDPMLEIPSGFFYLPVPIGAGLMALAFAQIAMRAASREPGEQAAPPPTIGEAE